MKQAAGVMLALALQLGPCRAEHVTQLLLRVRGGSDKPEVMAAVRRAGGELDGTRRFWWLPARNLRSFAAEMRREADPLFRLLEHQQQRGADAGEHEAVRRERVAGAVGQPQLKQGKPDEKGNHEKADDEQGTFLALLKGAA